METTNETPVQTTATVGVPDNTAADIAKVVQSANGVGVVGIILAIITVVGGTAGWKFWTKRQELKHELEMRKLDVEKEEGELQKALDKLDSDIAKVTAESTSSLKEIDKRIEALDARIAKLEKAKKAAAKKV
jgi:uncharacterized protein HemX